MSVRPLPAELIAACTGASTEAAARWAPALSWAMSVYRIDTPPRIAAFLAQIGHESGGLRYTTEIWGPTPAQQRYERDFSAPFERRDPQRPETFRNSLAFQLGNTEPGDGRRFCGHGPIQVTGRYNHCRRRDRLREWLGDAGGVPDFEQEPEQLATVKWGALAAADFWNEHGLNALADAGDFVGITKVINGGVNGLSDRQARFERGQAWLKNWKPDDDAQDLTPSSAPPVEPPTSTLGPGPEPVPTFRSPEMAPFLPMAFSAVAEVMPSLIRLFGGSEVSERNAKAAELVVAAAKQATGARNEQELIETLKNDPAAVPLVQQAVKAVWHEISLDTSGIEGARRANAEATKPWLNPALWVTVLLLPLPYMTVHKVLTGDAFTSEVKSMVVASIVTGLLSGIVGYWLGTSFSSSRKTEMQQAGPPATR